MIHTKIKSVVNDDGDEGEHAEQLKITSENFHVCLSLRDVKEII